MDENGNPIVPSPEGTPPEGQSGGEPKGEGGGEPQTFELADGRKLTGEQVLEEYNKLLPDYTKKSQELSELKKPKEESSKNPWEDPNYSPKSWNEVLTEAETRALAKMEAREKAEKEAQTKQQQDKDAVSKQIDDAVQKIKLTDKELNGDDMFAFAAEKAKKGVQYTSVDALYEDYKNIREARKQGQQDAIRNMNKRGDMGAGSKGQGDGKGAIDYATLRKSQSITDAVAERIRQGL